MWVTSVLLDLPGSGQQQVTGSGSSPTYANLLGQAEPTSMLPSLALTGTSTGYRYLYDEIIQRR